MPPRVPRSVTAYCCAKQVLAAASRPKHPASETIVILFIGGSFHLKFGDVPHQGGTYFFRVDSLLLSEAICETKSLGQMAGGEKTVKGFGCRIPSRFAKGGGFELPFHALYII